MPLTSPATETQRFEPRRRLVTLDALEPRGNRMVRCWFAGDDLADFVSPNATDHIKLQVPDAAGELVEPVRDAETGRIRNRHELGLRDMTPRVVDSGRVAIDIVRHDGGVVGAWLERARVGDQCALLGPRGSKRVTEPLDRMIAVVDLAALPAVERRFRELALPGELHLVGDGIETLDLPDSVTVSRHPDAHGWQAVIAAVQGAQPQPGRTFVWGAGEATRVAELRAALRQIDDLDVFAQFNGYWQRGVSEYDHHAELPTVN